MVKEQTDLIYSLLSEIEQSSDLNDLVSRAARSISGGIGVDAVEVVVGSANTSTEIRHVAFFASLGEENELYDRAHLTADLIPLNFSNNSVVALSGAIISLPLLVPSIDGAPTSLHLAMVERGLSSLAILPIENNGALLGYVQLINRSPSFVWRGDIVGELFTCVSAIGKFVHKLKNSAKRDSTQKERFREVVGRGRKLRRRQVSKELDEVIQRPVTEANSGNRILDEVPFPSFLLSKDGILLEGNAQFERFFGPVQSVCGRSLKELSEEYLSRTQAQAILTTLAHLIDQGSVYQRCDWRGEGPLAAVGDHTVHIFRLGEGEQSSQRFACVILPSGRRSFQSKLLEVKVQYKRLIDYAGAVVLRTDSELTILSVSGDVSRIVGIPPYALILTKLLGNEDIARLIPRVHRAKIMRKFRRYLLARIPLQDDIQVELPNGRGMRWLSLMVVPHYGDAPHISGSVKDDFNPETDTVFLGWEVIVTDVSDTKRIDHERMLNKRRLNALYRMTRALEFGSEPRLVTERGLHALIEATGAQCGYVTFFDRASGQLEVIASHGLPIKTVEMLESRLQAGSLTRSIIESGKGVLIDDLPKDPRYSGFLLAEQGLRSAVVVPLLDEDMPLGAVAVYSPDAFKFTQGDFDFALAAASQIGVAGRRAEFYLNQKRQADSYAALYRLSHEVSKHLSPRDIGLAAFPIIQEELACKRMWLGVINEAGSHLVGQAGVGPGMRKSLETLRIEMRSTERQLQQVLESGNPTIIDKASSSDCISLSRVARTLEIGAVVIVPLTALSQTIGVLIVEPIHAGAFFSQKKLPLLSSMATELATVMLARRFEEKMAISEKMRAAGVLASGVAHNFNNLLQAVMGQASLIEMQATKDSAIHKASSSILAAAERGTNLIAHLLHFSPHKPEVRTIVNIGELIKTSTSYYRTIVGATTLVEINVPDEELPVYGDHELLQQVFSTVLINAKEAIEGRLINDKHYNPRIVISVGEVAVAPSDVDGLLIPGDYIRIDIADNGKGMTSEEESRCFEPFFTTKNVDSRLGIGITGAGLGLSTAYSVLRHHQGHLTVTTESGRGSMFSVFLPRAVIGSINSKEKSLQRLASGIVAEVVLIGFPEEEEHRVATRFEAQGVVVAFGRSISEVSATLNSTAIIIAYADNPHFDINDLLGTPPSLHICLVSDEAGRWQSIRALNRERFEVIGKPFDVWKIHAVTRRVMALRVNEFGLDNKNKPSDQALVKG